MNEIRNQKHPSLMTDDEKFSFRLNLDRVPLDPLILNEKRKEEARERLNIFVLRYLDKLAVSKGYGDNGVTPMAAINSIVSYIEDKNTFFAAEAQVFKDYRSDVWTLCDAISNDVELGLRAIPTEEELLAELPPIVWPT
jgi:hypothetical protein